MATSVRELQAEVASRFDRLGLPSWPHPRPDRSSPREEDYSRVTDPGRYRVVHARARLWAAVLDEVVGARTEVLAPPPAVVDGRRTFDRGIRLTSRRPGALPLLLLERDVPTRPGDPPLAVLEIAVARPDVTVESRPDCGCDACDSGSDDLLEAVDSMIGAVVGGPFAVLRGPTWHAVWHPDGGGAAGGRRAPDLHELTDLCRRLAEGGTVRLPRRTEAFVGRSWST